MSYYVAVFNQLHCNIVSASMNSQDTEVSRKDTGIFTHMRHHRSLLGVNQSDHWH